MQWGQKKPIYCYLRKYQCITNNKRGCTGRFWHSTHISVNRTQHFLSIHLSVKLSFFHIFGVYGWFLNGLTFIVACTWLYNPLCRSVRPSVRPSVTLYFFSGFCGLWPHHSCPNDVMTSNKAPAHPHPTGSRVSDLVYCPCTPTWVAGRVSSLVLSSIRHF